MEEGKELVEQIATDTQRALNGLGLLLQEVRSLKAEVFNLHEHVEKLSKLKQFPESSETIGKLTAAKALAKLEAQKIMRNGRGNRNEYATMEDLREAFEGPLAKNGLDITFFMTERNGEWLLASRLSHSSGEWFQSVSRLNSEKQSIQDKDQAMAASLSYQKRYMFMVLVGI